MPKYSLQHKRDRIAELTERLQRGEKVPLRDVDLVLTDEQCKEMRDGWQEQLKLRDEEKPAEILEYERMLREALLSGARYEKVCRNKPSTAKEQAKWIESRDALGKKQESLFEDALGRLEEIITESPELQTWFDRDIDFGAGSNIGTNAAEVPRVVTSRSKHNIGKNLRGERFGKRTKAEHKIEVLLGALDEVDKELMTDEEKRAAAEQQAATSAKLKAMLAKLKKSSEI